jgi:hypothetical protein
LSRFELEETMLTSRAVAAFLAALALASCASIPLPSLVALRRVDFLTTDLAELRVAIQLPNALRTRADGVKMIATVTFDGGLPRTEVLLLQEAKLDRDGSMTAKPGFQTRGFRLRDVDVVRLEAIRTEIVAARAEGRRGSLGINIEAKEFCRASEISNGPVLSTTFLRTSETSDFLPVVRDFDLRSDARIRAALSELEPC